MDIQLISDTKEARASIKLCGERSPVLSEVELHVFRGATLYVLWEAGVPLSYNVTRFGKRKKNVWEPYANWYTAYTVTPRRRQGLASQLCLHVKALAVAKGCVRLKALAGTRAGLMLHVALGDQLWGLTAKLEVAVDTPLVDNPAYVGRTPPNAACDDTEPWTLDRVTAALDGRTLCYDR